MAKGSAVKPRIGRPPVAEDGASLRVRMSKAQMVKLSRLAMKEAGVTRSEYLRRVFARLLM